MTGTHKTIIILAGILGFMFMCFYAAQVGIAKAEKTNGIEFPIPEGCKEGTAIVMIPCELLKEDGESEDLCWTLQRVCQERVKLDPPDFETCNDCPRISPVDALMMSQILETDKLDNGFVPLK